MEDFLLKVLGSRNKGFTKKQFFMAVITFGGNVDNSLWKTFYYRAKNHQVGFYFVDGRWHYEDAHYYRSLVKLITESNENYFGMAMGSLPYWMEKPENKFKFRSLFHIKDFL